MSFIDDAFKRLLDEDEIKMRQQEEEKYREGYLLYNERYKLFEIDYLSTYKLNKANIQQYEFSEPFEMSSNQDTPPYKKTEYTFWEKITRKPEKDAMELHNNEEIEMHNKRCSAANLLLRKSDYITREIKHLNVKAIDYVNTAEREFSKNTYALFWQAIENVTPILDQMAFLVWGLSVKINIDYRIITHKFHNFPPFFFLEAIPDPTNLINKYNKMVHEGLSNYEFASIWETFKTRKTLIEGFSSLETAVQDVSNTVQNGFIDLNKQLASNAKNQILATKIQTLILYYGLNEEL